MLFWCIITYIFIFTISVIGGCMFWFKFPDKGSRLLAIYEILGGIYIIFMLFAYIEPSYRKFLGIPNVIAVAAIILFDFYFTVFGDIRLLSQEKFDIKPEEAEIAKAISTVFSAPAYIMTTLLSVDILKKIWGG